MVKSMSSNELIDRFKDELKNKSREELLEIFRDEVLNLDEKRYKNELDEAAKLTGLLIRLRIVEEKAKRDEDRTRLREIRSQIRNIRSRLNRFSPILEMMNTARKYRQEYERLIFEGFQTTQKITNEFLIQAIAEMRARKAELTRSADGRTDRRLRKFRGIRVLPYDWAGYNENKYPPWIHLDPEKVVCENCGNWDEKKQYCLVLGKSTRADYCCYNFRRRGL